MYNNQDRGSKTILKTIGGFARNTDSSITLFKALTTVAVITSTVITSDTVLTYLNRTEMSLANDDWCSQYPLTFSVSGPNPLTLTYKAGIATSFSGWSYTARSLCGTSPISPVVFNGSCTNSCSTFASCYYTISDFFFNTSAPTNVSITYYQYAQVLGTPNKNLVQIFNITGYNDPLVVAVTALNILTAPKNTPVSYTVPVTDPEGLTITQTLVMVDGSTVPSFIKYYSANMSFWVNPTAFTDVGVFVL